MDPKDPWTSFLDNMDLKQFLIAKIQKIQIFSIISCFLVIFLMGKSLKTIDFHWFLSIFQNFPVPNITKKHEKMKNSKIFEFWLLTHVSSHCCQNIRFLDLWELFEKWCTLFLSLFFLEIIIYWSICSMSSHRAWATNIKISKFSYFSAITFWNTGDWKSTF